jgi:hypothetical protein
MNDLQSYAHHQIDKFAEKYTGSPAVDEIIELKKKFDGWFLKKSPSIHAYYASASQDNISYLCKHNSFKLRLTFYKNGDSRLVIEHSSMSDILIRDIDIINTYCVDAGSVYFIESEFGWKIGKTKNIRKRKNVFDVKLPFEYAVRCQIKTHRKTYVERYFHNYFKDRLINGEWYDITDDDIIAAVKTDPSLKLSSYSPDDHIKIKYIPKYQTV